MGNLKRKMKTFIASLLFAAAAVATDQDGIEDLFEDTSGGLISENPNAECDLMCAAIYSVDTETCDCVPIAMMECHPQYNEDCNQCEKDIALSRNPMDNPYREEEWYRDCGEDL